MTSVGDNSRVRTLEDARARRVRLRSAMDALEDALAAPVPGRVTEWWAAMARCLGDLRLALHRHRVEAEADGGMLAQIETDAPRLANAVNRLRDEHVELGEVVDALRARPVPTDGDSAAIREAGLGLLNRLARHRQLGADLLYEAYSVDVGIGD